MKKTTGHGKDESSYKLNKVQLTLLKELDYLNNWLKMRNPKKMTTRVQDLIDEIKVIKNSGEPIKAKMEQHLKDKTEIIKDAIERKLDDLIVFDNFIKIIKPDFKENSVIMKHINDTIKHHDIYSNDLRKAKELIAKI